jgi:hypothetical protein
MRPGIKTFGVVIVAATLLVRPPAAAAQAATTAAPTDAVALAKATQNPVSSLISVPLQGNWDFGLGDRDATSTLLNLQPVMPFAVSESTNLILRVIVPLTSQPGAEGARLNGMGDIVTTLFFSPANSGTIIWGVGPVFLLPTATSNGIGSEKFGVGPSVVVLTQPGNWTLGLLFNQIWSVSGANDRSDVNSTFLQPFANYNLGHGLSVGASMEATGNWEADTEQWNAPLLFNISKVTRLGRRPVSFQLAAGPFTPSPEAGASWRFRLAANFLFPR